MNKSLSTLKIFAAGINKTHIQIFFLLVSLTMLVLGGGALEDFGGGSR